MNLSKYGIDLNKHLVKKQNRTQEDVDYILELHKEKYFLFQQFNSIPTLSELEIKELVLEVEDLEFFMQKAWGFKEDRDFHTHWMNVPFCSCSNTHQTFGGPKLYLPDCIVHHDSTL